MYRYKEKTLKRVMIRCMWIGMGIGLPQLSVLMAESDDDGLQWKKNPLIFPQKSAFACCQLARFCTTPAPPAHMGCLFVAIYVFCLN